MNEPDLELSVPVGVSGAFLRDKNRFAEIRRLYSEFNHLCSMLEDIERKLHSCNDPEWLTAFERRCLRLKRDAETALVAEESKLQTRRAELASSKEETRQKLLELEPSALDVHHTLGGSSRYLNPPVERRRQKQVSPEVGTRNKAIDSLLHLSNLGICKELDDMFPYSDRPAPQLPHAWPGRFDVKTFEEAYENKVCRHLVHTMISKRRKLSQSP